MRLPYYFSDLLALTAAFHLACLIGLTYSQSPVGHRRKESQIFLLEFVVALMYCWQFRLLDKVGVVLQSEQSPKLLIITFYLSHIGLVLTMLPFRFLSEKNITFLESIKKFWLLRVIGLATPVAGIAAELSDYCLGGYLPYIRWVIAVMLLALAIIWYISLKKTSSVKS